MAVRNEELYIDLNIAYHLDLGVDYLFIADHCSTDRTTALLETYATDPRVVVLREKDPVFDHARIVNGLVAFANANYAVDWWVFLDADEFLVVPGGSLCSFIRRMENQGIPYATIGWLNALFDSTFQDYTCSATNPIDTFKFFEPWPEKDWQEYGHFRKAIVRNHRDIEVVVGGHYVETGRNTGFFGRFHWNPFVLPREQARILHFEYRSNGAALYQKWQQLALHEQDRSSSPDAPWLERIQTIRRYVADYAGQAEAFNQRWFAEHRSFWGTPIPKEKIVYDVTLVKWYGKYIRRKLEKGAVRTLCLVRSGHLGDVVMSEPVARFLRQFVRQLYLATAVEGAAVLFKGAEGLYDAVLPYDKVIEGQLGCDAVLKLVYEFGSNQQSYIQSYMEYIGFGEVKVDSMPVLRQEWPSVFNKPYFLVAPYTSAWERQKRCWPEERFVALAGLVAEATGWDVVWLRGQLPFEEMLALIRHCVFLIGNDSGPAVIAQSFSKRSFILFGATSPKYLHLSEQAVPIAQDDRHVLCQHNNRQEEIDCCEPFCMERLRVENVFEQVCRQLVADGLLLNLTDQKG